MAEVTVKEYYTPADRWLDYLNRKYPNLWAYLKKNRESMPFIISKEPKYAYLKDVPAWVEMPSSFPNSLIDIENQGRIGQIAFGEINRKANIFNWNQDEIMDDIRDVSCELSSMASFYLWRKSKGVYRFSPELYETLINQPFDGDLNTQPFFHLPEWAMYVEAPGLTLSGMKMEGFVVHVDYHIDSRNPSIQYPCLLFDIFYKHSFYPETQMLPLIENAQLSDCVDEACRVIQLQNGILSEAFGRESDYEISSDFRNSVIENFKAMLNLLTYLCSEEPDVIQRNQPVSHSQKKQKGDIPKEHRTWDVGVRISHVLKKYKVEENAEEQNDGNETGTTVRPHIRRAHWHSYWVGPREEVYPIRKIIIKWLPPIPVNVRWQDELPVNIKLVDEDSNL